MLKSLTTRAGRTPRVQIRAGRLYWEPAAALRRAGFKSKPLGPITAAALAAADELNAAADAHLAAAADARPAPLTAGDILARYIAAAKISERTRRDYLRHAARAGRIRDTRGDQLTPRECMSWHDELARTSPADARNTLALARAAFGWAAAPAQALVPANPFGKIELARRERRQRIGTRAELWAMIRQAERMGLDDFAAAILTMPAIMQRADDTIRLTRRHVEGGTLYLRQSKTGAEISFRLHPLALDRLGGGAAEPEAPLFRNPRTGGAYGLRAFERDWDRVRAAAAEDQPSLTGADPSVREPTLRGALRVQDLRRTGMVWAAEGGASVIQITAVSGHTLESGLEILETYLPRHRLLANQAIGKLDMIRAPDLADPEALPLAS